MSRRISAATFGESPAITKKLLAFPQCTHEPLLRSHDYDNAFSGRTQARLTERDRIIATKHDVERRMGHYLRHYRGSDEDAAYKELQQEHADAKAALGAFDARWSEEKNKPFTSSYFSWSDIIDWTNGEREGQKYRAVPITVSLKKGETIADAVELASVATLAVASEMDQVLSATFSLEEAYAAAERDIERHAKIGAPNIAKVLRRNAGLSVAGKSHRYKEVPGSVEWPTEWLEGSQSRAELGVAFTIWMFKSEMIERAKQEIRAAFAPANALDDKTRTARLAELDAQLLAAQRVEEAWRVQADKAGLIIARKSQSNVLAYLGIERVTNEQANRS